MNNKIRKFLSGRYAVCDELYNFIFGFALFLMILNLFIRVFVIEIIIFLLLIYMTYRFMSKNISKRAQENTKYLQLKAKVLKPFTNIKRNLQDKEHVYKKCPKCKTILKLPVPSKRGWQKAKCPHCHKSVKLFTLKQINVEVIKKKTSN